MTINLKITCLLLSITLFDTTSAKNDTLKDEKPILFKSAIGIGLSPSLEMVLLKETFELALSYTLTYNNDWRLHSSFTYFNKGHTSFTAIPNIPSSGNFNIKGYQIRFTPQYIYHSQRSAKSNNVIQHFYGVGFGLTHNELLYDVFFSDYYGYTRVFSNGGSYNLYSIEFQNGISLNLAKQLFCSIYGGIGAFYRDADIKHIPISRYPALGLTYQNFWGYLQVEILYAIKRK